MKRRNKHSDNEIIRRILQRESENQTADDILICSCCLCRIVHGRYYEIGGEAICGDCIDSCERRK